MKFTISAGAATHIGRRSNNEDQCLSAPTLGLFAVADGMGGYEGGEVAAKLAVDALREFYQRNRSEDDCTWPFGLDPQRSLAENMLAVATKLANARVAAGRAGRLKAMGSTVATLVTEGDRAIIAHVGDSRVYRVRGGQLAALTRDHSLYEELRAMGSQVGDRASFPHANVITRALGMSPAVKVDTRTEALAAGDVFVLCTDGLYDLVASPRVVTLVTEASPADAAARLVHEAYENGSKDNITAVVVRVDAAPSALGSPPG